MTERDLSAAWPLVFRCPVCLVDAPEDDGNFCSVCGRILTPVIDSGAEPFHPRRWQLRPAEGRPK